MVVLSNWMTLKGREDSACMFVCDSSVLENKFESYFHKTEEILKAISVK